MKYSIAVILFATLASAKKCTELTIPIEASARNGVFDIPIPANEVEVTNFILHLSQQGANYTEAVLSGVSTRQTRRVFSKLKDPSTPPLAAATTSPQPTASLTAVQLELFKFSPTASGSIARIGT